MGCVEIEAPHLSLNGGTTADNSIPHYLRPSTGSCHDICKYGRRRAADESSADARKPDKPPTPHARPKNHSYSSSQRGLVMRATNTSVGKKASMPSAKKAWMPAGRKTADVELKDRRRVKRVKTVKTDMSNPPPATPPPPPPPPPPASSDQEIKCNDNEVEIDTAQMKQAERNKFECESEYAPSTSFSSLEEAEEPVSDTAVYQRNRDHCKRRRRITVRDQHCSRPIRINLNNGNSTRHKFRRTRIQGDVSSCISDNNSSTQIGHLNGVASTDKCSSKTSKCRSRRVRCGKTRVLDLDNIVGDLKRKFEKEDGVEAMLISRRNNLKRRPLQRKDVYFLFNYLVEETLSKLAERRKGTVKNLVGVYESLIALQARSRYLRIAA